MFSLIQLTLYSCVRNASSGRSVKARWTELRDPVEKKNKLIWITSNLFGIYLSKLSAVVHPNLFSLPPYLFLSIASPVHVCPAAPRLCLYYSYETASCCHLDSPLNHARHSLHNIWDSQRMKCWLKKNQPTDYLCPWAVCHLLLLFQHWSIMWT